MILEHLGVNADLSKCSLEDALEKIASEPSTEVVLYVSQVDLRAAEELKRMVKGYHLDDNLPPYSWYVKGRFRGIFSVGP